MSQFLPCNTAPCWLLEEGTALCFAGLASSVQDSWEMWGVLEGWAWGTDQAGLETGYLVHTAGFHNSAVSGQGYKKTKPRFRQTAFLYGLLAYIQ